MPVYIWRCPKCGTTTSTRSLLTPTCKCGAECKRDWRGENAQSLYHPTKGGAA